MTHHAHGATYDPETMPAQNRHWCVHLIGPDDLIPMPDHATADRAASRFNIPEIPAIVRQWPYDADGHAKALADLQADDPDGWLSE